VNLHLVQDLERLLLQILRETLLEMETAQHFISIMATQDNTKVTLSDFPAGIEFTNNDLAGAQTSPLSSSCIK